MILTNLCAEHAKDFRTLVIHNFLLNFVIQNWYAEPGLIVRVSFVIDLS